MTIKIGTKVECQDGEQGIVTHIIQNDELTYHIKMDNGSIRKLWEHDLTTVDQTQLAPEIEPVVNLSAALLLEAVRKFGDFMPEQETNDDLPFSDVGKDDEDTKPLPAVKRIQHPDGVIDYHIMGVPEYVARFDGLYVKITDSTCRTANALHHVIAALEMALHDMETSQMTVESKPTLSNLIDAALDPDNVAAYEALKAYDWASVPLWVLEIERDDLNAYKWEIWHELRKIPYGVMGSNPEHTAKQLEVERAFNVMAILNDAMYRYHKGVGFNVLD